MDTSNDSHTRRYLQALLVPLNGSPAVTQKERRTSASSDNSSENESKKSSNDEEDAASPLTPIATANNGDSAAADSSLSGKATGSGEQLGEAVQAATNVDNSVDVEARINTVLELLYDRSVPEEDRPDKLKDLLAATTAGTEAATIDPDVIVLAILHRHREDVAPTGQTFSSPSTLPRAGTMSRSSSFRRNLTPTSATTLALKRAGIVTPTRPLSPSPLRSQSPSLAGTHRNLDPFGHYLDSSAASTASGSSAPSSPFGSPRILNATAPHFKPNVGAVEFRPSTPTLASPGVPSLVVKMPEQAFRSRSPMGTPSIESPTLWSFQNSPLGTPKFASGTIAASPSFVGNNGGSYFPTSSGSPAYGLVHQPPAIPSDPWNRLSDSSGNSTISNPGVTHSSSTASSESSYGETSLDPFDSSPLVPQAQQSSGKDQILSAEEEDEWGIPSTTYEETAGRSPNLNGPNWNLYEDEEAEDDLQILQFKGGQLLQDELLIVEPPQQERPVFASAPVPQSTDQYSQLPQNFPSPTVQPGLPPGLNIMPGGLDASSNYIMTPFDVLCSIFAGSDVLPADLEEALSRNGYDIDRSMEWIINNPRLPGVPRQAEDQVDQLNMLSMDLNHLPGSGAASPARVHTPGIGGSGSRPMILSRDSFQRHLAPHGRPQSPRWAGGYSNNGSRPGTPRDDRGNAEGYFGAGAGGASSSSTRLCKYYLQGNCLRSDCRFSHDLSKAVCKFWLRGHCLKGEGRCEFLHSVPPHLAEDVAALRMDALRNREQEKTRWMHRGYEGEERPGFESARRVAEDFPTLAAATASTSARSSTSTASKDPASSRYAGIVKTGRAAPPVPVNNRPSLPRSPSDPSGRGLGKAGDRMPPYSQPRQSARLALRPPSLLPTISTGAAVSQLYTQYRENFFELGNSRNKCLVKAANCWQKGDGAGARGWSREATTWNHQIAREGAIAAGQIINERKKVLREAVMQGQRPGRVDETVDRQYRGQECGAGLGICLGVAAGEALGPEGSRLSVAERTEVALDLHGLHADEALEYLEKFLLAIASESVMRGICFVIVGSERHTGTADPARGTAKVRLADAVGEWLDGYGYCFWLVNGIYSIDPLL